jgi:hypothetical protein
MDEKVMFDPNGVSSKVEDALQDVNFPASKQEIVKQSEDKTDVPVTTMLEQLPDKQFESAIDVIDEVSKIK